MDLFGEVSVTTADVELWLDSIKQLSATPSRRAAYAKAYNVEEKIKTAKRNGNWPPDIDSIVLPKPTASIRSGWFVQNIKTDYVL